MKNYKWKDVGELIGDDVRMIDGKPVKFVAGCEPVWNPEWVFNAIDLGYDPDDLTNSDMYRLNAKPDRCHMYLEEFDGVRSVIVTDGDEQETHWWIELFEDGGKYRGVDVYDGDLEDVAERIRSTVTDRFEVIKEFMEDERLNSGWDRCKSLDAAEELELMYIGGKAQHKYIEI